VSTKLEIFSAYADLELGDTTPQARARLRGGDLGRFFLIGFPFVHDPYHTIKRPKSIGHASGHRRRYSGRLMDAHEIIVHEIDRKRVDVVLQLLRECVR
jgi:hypothetical protein